MILRLLGIALLSTLTFSCQDAATTTAVPADERMVLDETTAGHQDEDIDEQLDNLTPRFVEEARIKKGRFNQVKATYEPDMGDVWYDLVGYYDDRELQILEIQATSTYGPGQKSTAYYNPKEDLGFVLMEITNRFAADTTYQRQLIRVKEGSVVAANKQVSDIPLDETAWNEVPLEPIPIEAFEWSAESLDYKDYREALRAADAKALIQLPQGTFISQDDPSYSLFIRNNTMQMHYLKQQPSAPMDYYILTEEDGTQELHAMDEDGPLEYIIEDMAPDHIHLIYKPAGNRLRFTLSDQ